MTRRQFGLLASLGAPAAAQVPSCENSHIGTLCDFVAAQAAHSTLGLSYLRDEFRDLGKWQKLARPKLFDNLFYSPAPVAPDAKLIERRDRGDHWEEYLTFRTTADSRVPAYVLIPKNAKFPAPGVVALHDHGGFYLWGKEKILNFEDEHPTLTEFRGRYYSGKSIARDLARLGHVVIVIDMFYWGERRMILPSDPPALRNRTPELTAKDVDQFNSRMSAQSDLVVRSLMTAGTTWAGVMLWDDIRTLDYLLTRPEVDRNRIACVGLSVGGYRSYLLGALDQRVHVVVGAGWMTSFAHQIPKHIRNTVGLTFHIPGMYKYLDLPDFAALIAPRPLLLFNGTKDALFETNGIRAAYQKIERIYAKAKAPGRQACRLFDVPHEFNAAMQAESWDWFGKWLK